MWSLKITTKETNPFLIKPISKLYAELDYHLSYVMSRFIKAGNWICCYCLIDKNDFISFMLVSIKTRQFFAFGKHFGEELIFWRNNIIEHLRNILIPAFCTLESN